MNDSPHWLVTGGAGFIGHHLVAALCRRGDRLRVVDDFSTGLRERLKPFEGRFDLVEGSIVDPEVCARATAGVTRVLHQAAIPSVPRSVEQPVRSHMANATGTLNLLEAARAAGVRRFVYAGSSSAYGDTKELPKRESMPSMPLSPYAVAKLSGEHYVKVYHQVYGMETAAFRYFNVFGPGQDPDSGYAAVIPRFVTMALRGDAPTIFGDGEQTRDFTYIDNVVQANLAVAEAPADAIAGKVFNLGCGERISLNRLWSEIKRLTGTEVDAEYGPRRAGDVQDSLADISLLTDATGFVPEVGLREGLRRTVEFFRARAA